MPTTRRQAAKSAQKATRIALEGAIQGPSVRVSLDGKGAYAVVTLSATGQGTHVRWYYPDDVESPKNPVVSPEIPEDHPLFSLSPLSSLASIPSQEDLEIDQQFVTPPPSGAPVDSSVLRTPVNKLQRHDDRIGYQGYPFWKDASGVQEELVFLPEGYTTPQVVGIDQIQHIRGIRDQLTKLIDNGTAAKLFLNSRLNDAEAGPSRLTGFNEGRTLGPHGTYLLGPSGTELYETEDPFIREGAKLETEQFLLEYTPPDRRPYAF